MERSNVVPPRANLDLVFMLAPSAAVDFRVSGKTAVPTAVAAVTPMTQSSWGLCKDVIVSKESVKPEMTIGQACTAFLYKGGNKVGPSFFLTARHCVENLVNVFDNRQYSPDSLTLYQPSTGTAYRVSEIGLLPNLDVAFLRVNSFVGEKLAEIDYSREPPSVPLGLEAVSNTPAPASKQFYAIHHPMGLTQAVVTEKQDNWAAIVTSTGSSGAPIFAQPGDRIEGIVTSGKASRAIRVSYTDGTTNIPSGYCVVQAVDEKEPNNTNIVSMDEIRRAIGLAPKQPSKQFRPL